MDQDVSDLRLYSHVEATLKKEVDRAARASEVADMEFRKICAEPGGGDPDQIERSAKSQLEARKTLLAALERFNKCILYGTVPDDLKRSEAAL